MEKGKELVDEKLNDVSGGARLKSHSKMAFNYKNKSAEFGNFNESSGKYIVRDITTDNETQE